MTIAETWPLPEADLRSLIAQAESTYLEFKRDWYDLERKDGKGELLKDVLALANALSPNQIGLIIIGREDDKDGAGLVGIQHSIREEQLHQLLDSYAARIPLVRYGEHVLNGVRLGVVRIEGTGGGPYYLSRPVAEVSDEVVYIRKGTIITRLSPAELEDMIRSRHAASDNHPISCGFLELPYSSGPAEPLFQLRNSSLDPISGVTAIFDAMLITRPAGVARWVPIPDMTLYPGNIQEIRLRRDMFQFVSSVLEDGFRSRTEYHWIDLRATVNYRDHHGHIRSIEHTVRLDWRT